MMRIVTLLVLSLSLARPCGAQELTPPAQDGERVFRQKGCYECHGLQGQGSLSTGPRIGMPPLPFNLFTELVRRPRNVMPAYSSAVLSDAELRAIHSYLLSLPKPPRWSELPQLRD
ncbi:c-type cytochrome [Bradyrhizobium sp. 14AA]